MKKANEFTLKVFCGNCYNESTLRFRKGVELEEKGIGSNKSIMVKFPNNKWCIAECLKCGSDRLNKRV